MPRQKFRFDSVDQHFIEPYDPSDRFDDEEWERVCTGFRSKIPDSLVVILKQYAGGAFAAPVSFGGDVYDEDVDVSLETILGPRSMRIKMSHLHHEFGARGILPVFAGIWNLVYVVDGEESGRMVDMEYYEEPSLFGDSGHFSVVLDRFLENLWFCPEMYFPESPTEVGKRLVPAALGGNWEAIASAIGRGVDVDSAMDSNGWTMLWYAAWANQTDLMRKLISHGADVDKLLRLNKPNGDEFCSALAVIAKRGVNLSAAEVLLKAGADVTTGVSSGHKWFDKRTPAPLMYELLKRYGFNQPTKGAWTK